MLNARTLDGRSIQKLIKDDAFVLHMQQLSVLPTILLQWWRKSSWVKPKQPNTKS